MSVENKFSCFIVGDGTLPIQCAEILLRRGHDIYGIISSDASLIRWAKENNLPYIKPTDDISAFTSRQPFDYLFSIVNEHVLPKDILALPRKYAINYHDAPLPKYAGSHATSWAIIHQETSHGVTWHVMGELVDAGDILKQGSVDIIKGETALTLNAKCYETATYLFAELVDDLSSGQVLPRKQNLDERTWFARYKRPPTGCVFSWNTDIHGISALIRALDFGPYLNPIGLPKFSIDHDFIIVHGIDITDTPSETTPGTVTKIDSDSLTVSTTDHEIVLRKLSTIDGQPLSIPDIVARFGLHQGYQFKEPDQEIAERITACYESVSKYETFWVKRLATLRPIVLPYANQNAPQTKTAQFTSLQIPIPDEVKLFLNSRCAGWSLSDFLLAAFAAYLARIGGIDRFDIGFRGIEQQRELAGLQNFFAQFVPLRLEVANGQTFEEFFHTVREQVELVGRRKTYARDLVTRYPALGSESKLRKTPMFPVSIACVEALDSYEAMPEGEFTLIIAEDKTECRWVYDADVLDETSISRMLNQFSTFLLGIIANPNQPIANLPLLTEHERHQLLVEFNDTEMDYPQDQCLHELFEAQVEQTPDAVAVIFEDERLTYRELNCRANQLAHYLQKLGVGSKTLVGVYVERSLEMAIGLLGILKAGAAYVPLDPTYPQERLAFMLEDTQASVLLTQQRLVEALPQSKAKTICLDADWEMIAQESEENPVNRVNSDNLVYVIYTSGSTGKPKGVKISHRALVNHNMGVIRNYGLQSHDRVLQFASISFDVAAEEIFPTWLSGATLVLRPNEIITSPADFSQFVEEEKLTILNLPTPYWHEWVSVLAHPNTQLPPTLRILIIGSEKASPDQFALWQKLFGNRVELRNAYGLTEATITSTIYAPPISQEPQEIRSVPIGRPIPNTQIYILDAQMTLLPIGVSGELYIGGASLAQGYLNRPDLTAEKFVRNPFVVGPNATLYRTGDLARWLPDGNIELLGRVDHQVKIRGFRVELGEVETTLRQHPLVQESIVMAREDQPGQQRLVAYLKPEGEDKQIELWPSPGDYQIWDEVMYYAMTHDKLRVERFKAAIDRSVKDKVVVDIGTGKDLVLTRLCVDAGAKKVYSIEANDRAYEQAKQYAKSLGLQDKVFLFHGDSTTVQLPEKVDVCVSELIGTIGGSEGVVSVLNNARKFLKPDGLMIPQQCITRIAAVYLPDELNDNPRFTKISSDYVRKIFDKVGRQLDLRVCINNLPESNIISNVEIFEDLDFSGYINTSYEREVTLTINKNARLDGFLLWLNLHTITGVLIDNLFDQYNWMPVYFPVFDGLEVQTGDTIQAVCSGWLSEDNVNPDYSIKGRLIRRNGETIDFEHNSLLYGKHYKSNEFYEKLFSGDEIKIRPDLQTELSYEYLRKYLERQLPPYMVPAQFLLIKELPLMPNGKVDRRALPAPENLRPKLETAYSAPQTDMEQDVAKIWQEVLNVEKIGIHDDFFNLGGHSLLATQVVSRLRETFNVEVSLRSLFEATTVAELAQHIETMLLTRYNNLEDTPDIVNREELEL